MTEARSFQIADALMRSEDYATKMLSLSVEEAVEEFNKEGYDFTKEELIEFRQGMATLIKAQQDNVELDEEALSTVAGGCWRCVVAGEWTVVAVLVTAAMLW